MADLLGTDEFLVNRNDVTYTQQQETLMATLQDTDHLLINRAGQTYKITGSDLINSVIDPLEVTVILAPVDGYTDTEVTAVPVVSGGKQPDGGYIFSYQWVTADDAAGTNKANIAGETGATFTPTNAQVDKYLGCVVSTTDALGTSAEGEEYIGPIQVLAQPPVISDVTVSEIYDGANRFTDKEFPYITTMAVDGEPNPTYEVKAKLSGTTFDFGVKSDTITDVEGGGIAVCETELIESVDEQVISTTATVRRLGHPVSGAANDLRIYSWDDLIDEETVTFGQAPNSAGPYAFQYCKLDTPEKIEFGAAPQFTAPAEIALWRSDTGLAGSWVLDIVDTSNTPNPETPVKGTTPALYWCAVRGPAAGQPHSYTLNMDGTTWFWYSQSIPDVTLTFPSAQGFDCFEPGQVVQGPTVALGEEYKQAVSSSSETTLSAPSSISGWQNTALGESSFNTDANIIYAEFNIATSPIFTRYMAGGSPANNQTLCYWNGSSWIVDDSVDGVISTSNFLQGQAVARYWCAFRSGTALSIGSQVTSFSDTGLPWSAGAFVFSAEDADQVKVISKDDSDPYTITVDGGKWDDSNQSQVWSSNYTGDPDNDNNYPTTRAFDGNLSTTCYPVDQSGKKVTWTFNNLTGTTFEVVALYGGAFPGLKVNGSDVSGTGDNNTWVDISTEAAGQLTSLEIASTGGNVSGLSAVRVDGILLVDAANDSQVWSQVVTVDEVLTKRSLEILFNGSGDKATEAPVGLYAPSTSDSFTLNFTNADLTQVTKVEVGVYNPNDNATYNSYSVNDGSFTEVKTGFSAVIYDGAGITLETITVKTPDKDNIDAEIRWIKINDLLLIDKGIRDLGDNKLVKETPYDTILTLAGSEALDVLTAGTSVKMGDAADVPYQPISDEIVRVDEYTFNATYTGESFIGFEGPNAFDVRKDKLAFPNGAGPLFESQPDQRSTKAAAGKSIVITFNEDMEVTDSSEIYVLYQSEANQASASYPSIVVHGRTSSHTVSNPGIDAASEAGLFKWAQVPATIGDIWKIEVNSTTSGIAGLAQVKINGANVVEGVYASNLILYGDTDLAYFREGDVVQEGGTEYERDFISYTGGTWNNGSWNNVLDGNPSTEASWKASRGNPVPTMYLDKKVAGSTVTILYNCKQDNPDMSVNGRAAGFINSSSTREIDVDVSAEGGLESLEIIPGGMDGGDTLVVYWIKVDGNFLINDSDTGIKIAFIDESVPSILVNGGEWTTEASNQSQVWSSKTTGETYDGDTDWSKVFNGNISDGQLPSLAGGPAIFTPVPAITCKKFELKYFEQGTNADPDNKKNIFVTIDGVETMLPTKAQMPGGISEWETVFDGNVDKVVSEVRWGILTGADYIRMDAMRVDDALLVDPGVTGLGDSEVTCQSPLKAPTDWTVVESNSTANTLTLSAAALDNSQVWVANDNQAGIDFFVEPTNAVPIEQDFAYGKLQIVNNKAQVTGIQKDDPGFLPVPAKDYSLKFPALFPTGNEPDADIPRGACIAAIVAAQNSEGRSEKESNCFMPLDVNPEGAAGPITATTPTQLTVATNSNLSEFSPGDNLVMVDENNDISNYTIVSDSIVSINTLDASDFVSATPTPNGHTGSSTHNIANIVDGDVATSVSWDIDTAFTITCTNFPTGTNYRVYGAASASGTDRVQINLANGETFNIGSSGTTWTSFTASSPTTVTSITGPGGAGRTDKSVFINALEVDGSIVSTGEVLTLASGQDLAYFRVGDAVQRDPNYLSDDYVSMSVINGTAVGSWDNVFNGVIGTGSSSDNFITASGEGDTCVFTPSTPIKINNNLTLYAYVQTLQGGGSALVFNGDVEATATEAYGAEVTYPAAALGGELKSITLKRKSTGANLAAIKIDGRLLIDPSVASGIDVNDVKVISVDAANSQMVVNGGEWDTSNQSEVWSNTITITNGSADTVHINQNAFDGVLNSTSFMTCANNGGGSVATYTFNPPIGNGVDDVVEVAWYRSGSVSAIPQVNGNDENSVTEYSAAGEWFNAGSQLVSLGLSHNQGFGANGIYGIRLNGEVLVDAANDSQVWSNGISVDSGTISSSQPATNAFDGNAFNSNAAGTENGTAMFFTTDAFAEAGSYEVAVIADYSHVVTISGVATAKDSGTGNIAHRATVGAFTEIKIQSVANKPDLAGVYVNGELLIDKGVRDLGDTEVTFGPVTGTGVFQVADQLNNTMTIQNSNDRWIDNNNRLSKDFYARDNITVLNADNPKHVAMQQAIADAFDAFPVNVSARKSAIASNFEALKAGQPVNAEDLAEIQAIVDEATS